MKELWDFSFLISEESFDDLKYKKVFVASMSAP
jgi:hypothetical protein